MKVKTECGQGGGEFQHMFTLKHSIIGKKTGRIVLMIWFSSRQMLAGCRHSPWRLGKV